VVWKLALLTKFFHGFSDLFHENSVIVFQARQQPLPATFFQMLHSLTKMKISSFSIISNELLQTKA
jgi:hypothetical protein